MRRPLYFYTYVRSPFEPALRAFSADASSWLPAPARLHDDGWIVELRAEGFPVEQIDALVKVSADIARPLPTMAVRSLSWQAANAGGLFPRMDGELELTALSDELVQLSLIGAYRPPLTVLGEVGDRLYGYRVAEAVIRAFTVDVANRLQAASLPA